MGIINLALSANDNGQNTTNGPLNATLVGPNQVSGSNSFKIVPVYATADCSAIVTRVTVTDAFNTILTNDMPLISASPITTLPAWISNTGSRQQLTIAISAIAHECDDREHTATITVALSSTWLSGNGAGGVSAVNWSIASPTSSFSIVVSAMNLPFGPENVFFCHWNQTRLYELEII